MLNLFQKNHQVYYEKVLEIKKDMALLNTRFLNLKKRAFKLKEQREENSNLLKQQKKKEKDDEEKLEAKVVLVENSENKSAKKMKNKVKRTTSKLTETSEDTEDRN